MKIRRHFSAGGTDKTCIFREIVPGFDTDYRKFLPEIFNERNRYHRDGNFYMIKYVRLNGNPSAIYERVKTDDYYIYGGNFFPTWLNYEKLLKPKICW